MTSWHEKQPRPEFKAPEGVYRTVVWRYPYPQPRAVRHIPHPQRTSCPGTPAGFDCRGLVAASAVPAFPFHRTSAASLGEATEQVCSSPHRLQSLILIRPF